jgi:hypothetical protein
VRVIEDEKGLEFPTESAHFNKADNHVNFYISLFNDYWRLQEFETNLATYQSNIVTRGLCHCLNGRGHGTIQRRVL